MYFNVKVFSGLFFEGPGRTHTEVGFPGFGHVAGAHHTGGGSKPRETQGVRKRYKAEKGFKQVIAVSAPAGDM